MLVLTINTMDTISACIEEKIERGHENYETGHGIVCGYRRFYLVARNKGGEAVGVLNAYTAYAEICIDDLWVDAVHRNRGIGRRLLSDLEARFIDKGYNNINLVTNAFQATPFYRKCGYSVEFVRMNKQHPKLSKTFLIKYLNGERQTQGILSTRS